MVRWIIKFEDNRDEVIVFECGKNEDHEMVAKMFIDIEDDGINYTVTKA